MKMTREVVRQNQSVEVPVESPVDFEKDIRVDIHHLELEWVRQPQLVWKYGKLAADAKDEVSRIENQISMHESDVAADVRKKPELFGLPSDKVTDKNIRYAIESDPTFQQLNTKLRKAKKNYDIIERAVTSIDHKKRSLEHLVKLLAMEYFSGPSVPHKIGAEVQDRLRDAQSTDFAERELRRRGT